MLFARLRIRNSMALLLAAVVPVMTAVAQESHVVPLTELHRDAAAATGTRQANLARVEKFFHSGAAQQALQTVRVDGQQVVNALPLLSDEELARLSARADKVDSDFAAGALTTQELTYIVIALATAVIILVIVAR